MTWRAVSGRPYSASLVKQREHCRSLLEEHREAGPRGGGRGRFRAALLCSPHTKSSGISRARGEWPGKGGGGGENVRVHRYNWYTVINSEGSGVGPCSTALSETQEHLVKLHAAHTEKSEELEAGPDRRPSSLELNVKRLPIMWQACCTTLSHHNHTLVS
jgi:hypothetical protein